MTKRLFPAALMAAFLLGGCCVLFGCNGDGGDTTTETPEQPAAALPDGLFVDAAPDGAKDVTEVKAAAKEGDTVVVRGKVGGTMEPFVAGRAAVMLGSEVSIDSCEVREGDGCETPWDYCCMTREAITAGTLTVQVVGADGKTLKVPLQGANGIDHLTVLVVKGTVGPRPDPAVLVVNAEAIHVEP